MISYISSTLQTQQYNVADRWSRACHCAAAGWLFYGDHYDLVRRNFYYPVAPLRQRGTSAVAGEVTQHSSQSSVSMTRRSGSAGVCGENWMLVWTAEAGENVKQEAITPRCKSCR